MNKEQEILNKINDWPAHFDKLEDIHYIAYADNSGRIISEHEWLEREKLVDELYTVLVIEGGTAIPF